MAVLGLSNLATNHFCTLFITKFLQIEYFVLHEIFCVRGWPIIFHLIISFFYLLYHNITSWTSSKSPYSTFCVKWNFVFTLRNSGLAKTWPTGLSATALQWSVSYVANHAKRTNGKFYTTSDHREGVVSSSSKHNCTDTADS